MENHWQLKMLGALKDEMKGTLQRLRPDNIQEIEEELKTQFDFAYSLVGVEREAEKIPQEAVGEGLGTEISGMEETGKITKEPQEPELEEEIHEEETGNVEEYEEPLSELAESFDKKVDKVKYRMKRNLVGGILQGGESLYVPEYIIREKGFEDGDFLYAWIDGFRNGKPLYHYELAEKGVPETTRNTFEFAIIEKDEGSQKLFIEKNASGQTIEVDGQPHPLYLQDYSVRRFNLEEGDIIDIAWYGENIQKFSVCWKHRVEDLPELTEEKRILQYQEKEANEEPTKEQLDELRKTFRIKDTSKNEDLGGIVVTIVGGYDHHSRYRETVEKNNGKVYLIPDDAHLGKMTAAIKRSDIVLINTDYVSHEDMYAAKERSKRYGVPFKAFKGHGRTNLLNVLLEQKEQLVEA